MIMKNESHVLLRCLNSIAEFIDYFTVVDTGSTDSSKQIIKDFFEQKNIPGQILDHPFVNFEDARNFAVKAAKDKTDFCFTIDCDETLTSDPKFTKQNLKEKLLTCDLGQVNVHYGGTIYGRRAFWKNSKDFRYFGVVHEVLVCNDTDLKGILIEEMIIVPLPDGASWKQSMKDKYLSHAKMFEDYIEKNGQEPRNVFYLAQSYQNAGEHEKAILWYQKRMGIREGFFEERYYSQLMIGLLKWTIARPVSEVADEFMRASEYDVLRAEHFMYLKSMYEKNERPVSAKNIGQLLEKYKGKNPYPQRVLFINPEAYA